MPKTGRVQRGRVVDYYEIAVRQFRQQILPPKDTNGNTLNPTTVWSYGSVNHPGTFNYPAFTIEAKFNIPVRIKWINDLVDSSGKSLPHLLPVDQTLHWANPPGGTAGRDMRPTFTRPSLILSVSDGAPFARGTTHKKATAMPRFGSCRGKQHPRRPPKRAPGTISSRTNSKPSSA
jgi:hypothetical protein